MTAAPVAAASSARRVFGVETEYGVTLADGGPAGLGADEVARYLFRKVVAWGRSSNVFLRNGARLYLDVGSHPEYATAECDSLRDLIAQDKAGERILVGLLDDAQRKMAADGHQGTVHLLKNNTDSVGNSFGCHENYLVRRRGDFVRLQDALLPFLISRQILTGAGKILVTPKGARFCFSQRADHMWESVSSATTRSRPNINTRDEPHADAELYRRLHVISGDSSMSEPTMLLKVGATDLVLRLLESGAPFGELTLENPMRAIREISHDLTGTVLVELASGRRLTAVDLQEEYLARVESRLDEVGGAPTDAVVLDLWRRGLKAIRDGDPGAMARELDWAIKLDLVERYRAKHDLKLSDPRVARLDLAYHDLSPAEGIYQLLAARGLVERIVSDDEIDHASEIPPETTRAALRGRFISAAQDAHRDYTVDWVHLKVNDVAGRTVICKDPFVAEDQRVDELIESLRP